MTQHADTRAEHAAIAALLQDLSSVNRALIVEEGLRPEHFTNPTLAAVMGACVALHDDESGTAPAVVFARLAGRVSAQKLDQLSRGDWSVGSLREYCPVLVAHHAWRTRAAALEQLRNAVVMHDDAELDRALTSLAAADT